MAKVIRLHHSYVAVSNLSPSEVLYDGLMQIPGFRKHHFEPNGEPRIQHFSRHFGYVTSPTRVMC